MDDMPIIIRLTLERMEAQIIQAISPREIELRKQIEEAVHHAVTSYDFAEEIRQQVGRELMRQIQHRVSFEVEKAFREVSYEDEINRRIAAEVKRQLLSEAKRQLIEE